MKSYFALHCITKRNIDNPCYDKELAELGYDENLLLDGEYPSKIDIAQGQIDEHLIEKGKKQAEFLAKQIVDFKLPIKKIYCADQNRCKETAEIIASKIGIPCEITIDKRLNARNYGTIAEQQMDSDKLKHFWKYDVDYETLKTIALFLVAPEQIGAEKNGDFKDRVREFFSQNKKDLDNALIIAGSDVWKMIKKDNYFYSYKNEQDSDLNRGQIAFVDYNKQKETKKVVEKQKEM